MQTFSPRLPPPAPGEHQDAPGIDGKCGLFRVSCSTSGSPETPRREDVQDKTTNSMFRFVFANFEK